MSILRGFACAFRQNSLVRFLLLQFSQNQVFVCLEEICLEIGNLFMTIFERAGDCRRRFGQ